MTDVTLHRVAWSAARDALTAVRVTVFVDEQGVPPDMEIDAEDPAALHVMARTDSGEVVGTGRLLYDGHVGRLAVLPSWRDRGIGTKILRELMASAAEIGMGQVLINAQIQAIPFYERLGFETEGEIFDEAGIPHRHMRIQL